MNRRKFIKKTCVATVSLGAGLALGSPKLPESFVPAKIQRVVEIEPCGIWASEKRLQKEKTWLMQGQEGSTLFRTKGVNLDKDQYWIVSIK